MKATLKFNLDNTDDAKAHLRSIKSLDMAAFIFELVNNGWREFKHTDYDYKPAWEKINRLLEEYGINIEELID